MHINQTCARTLSIVLLLGAAGSLHAQQNSDGKQDLSNFDMSQYESGWSANAMLDTEVYGEDGEEVGEVENIIVNQDGQVDRLLIETDNWLDLGDRMVSVPWNNVDTTPGEEGIVAQLDEDHMDDFSLFAGDDVDTDSKSFRVSELIGDYVTLEDHSKYGYVKDVVFDQKGNLVATAVTADATFGSADYGGYYAYPYYGYGYDYGYTDNSDTYALPYNQQEVSEYQPFDYEVFEDSDI